jgi:uncharacterized protein
MKARRLTNAVKERSASKTGRIIVLTGARQTGKTTFSRLSFPDFAFISVEDPVLRYTYKKLTAQQWHEYYPNAILDEVHKEPQLIESIKSVYDQYPDSRYILTGSSQLLLMQKVKESLAGRSAIFEMYPLTLPEMLTETWEEPVKLSLFQQLVTKGNMDSLVLSFRLIPDFPHRIRVFTEYLNFGGYPALSDPALKDDEKWDWLKAYIRTYLERDIRDIADFRYLEPFVKLQKISALMTGQLVNFAALAKESGVTPNTARTYMNYMEISYQSVLLNPWHKNHLKRLSKSPKVHFLDPGVQRAIVRNRGDLSGHAYESAVIAEMVKQLRTIPFNGAFHHLRTIDGREVDFLLELESGYFAFEIKMTENVTRADARHLQGLDEILDKPVLGSFVLSNDTEIKRLEGNVTALPAAMFLS